MSRRLEPGKLVIASHNPGKVREIADLLGPYGIEPVSAADLDLPEPDETGNTFIDNAELKARLAADLSGLPALAEAGRNAHFICALSVCWPDGHIESFEGRVDGLLVWPPRGENGFGYDPMFMPVGREMTFGQMDPVDKYAMSHRAKAFRKLVAALIPSNPPP